MRNAWTEKLKDLESLNAALKYNIEAKQALINHLIDANVNLEEALTREVEKNLNRLRR